MTKITKYYIISALKTNSKLIETLLNYPKENLVKDLIVTVNVSNEMAEFNKSMILKRKYFKWDTLGLKDIAKTLSDDIKRSMGLCEDELIKLTITIETYYDEI